VGRPALEPSQIERASEEDEMSTSKQSQPAARRRGELHRADGNRQVGHAIGASGHIAPGTRAGDRLHVRWGEQSGR
jgi:hypothetical protein